MNKSNKAAAVLLVLLLSCFAAGLWRLLALRFEAGDVFPAYSSLRPDPLGVKALFQALEQIPDVSVERHYLPLSKLAGTPKLTLFYLGLEPSFLMLSNSNTKRLETLAGEGARIVLAFRSGQKKRTTRIVGAAPGGKEGNPGEEPQQPKEETPAKDEAKKPVGEKWEVKTDYLPAPAAGEENKLSASLREQGEQGLPPVFSLHTALCFKDPGPEWRVLYSAGECPVIIERALGAGSLVLIADSYLFSNEAMLKQRLPALISRLAGDCRLVVFDEFHLGVSERPGMMTLLRKYRLHGFFVSLLVLAGLFAWQNLVRFIPESPGEEKKEPLAAPGTDQLEGLINLLQRNIKADILLKTCFEEWERSIGPRLGMEEKIRLARDILQDENGKGRQKNLAAAYKEIARILSDRTGR